MPDYDICPTNMSGNIKNKRMLEINEIKIIRKIVGKIKTYRIRNQQIRILLYPTF